MPAGKIAALLKFQGFMTSQCTKKGRIALEFRHEQKMKKRTYYFKFN